MLQKKYSELKDGPNLNKKRADLRKAVKSSEQDTLEMLVELFDWLDSLEGVDPGQLQDESSDYMERELELLNNARGNR